MNCVKKLTFLILQEEPENYGIGRQHYSNAYVYLMLQSK